MQGRGMTRIPKGNIVHVP